MLLDPLKEVVNRYKNNPKEVEAMCAELEKWRLEERAEGRVEEKVSVAKVLLRKKMSLKDIEEITGLPLVQIKQLVGSEG